MVGFQWAISDLAAVARAGVWPGIFIELVGREECVDPDIDSFLGNVECGRYLGDRRAIDYLLRKVAFECLSEFSLRADERAWPRWTVVELEILELFVGFANPAVEGVFNYPACGCHMANTLASRDLVNGGKLLFFGDFGFIHKVNDLFPSQ